MTVVSMPGRDCRAAAILLAGLLKQALKGQIDGVNISVHHTDGAELDSIAGFYEHDLAAALKASLRQSCKLGLLDKSRQEQRTKKRRKS